MKVLFDQEQLTRLISNLQTLTGIRANILDGTGRDICLTSGHSSFCEKINADPDGHARCLACDAAASRDKLPLCRAYHKNKRRPVSRFFGRRGGVLHGKGRPACRLQI